MSSNKHKTNRESIEAAANELGISFEELLELKNEFKNLMDISVIVVNYNTNLL